MGTTARLALGAAAVMREVWPPVVTIEPEYEPYVDDDPTVLI